MDVETRTSSFESVLKSVRLHDIPELPPRTEELDQVLRETIAAVVALQDAKAGILSLVLPAGQRIQAAASVGFSDRYLEAAGIVPIGDGACGRALETAKATVVEDTESAPAFANFRDAARLGGFRSVFAVPLLGRRREAGGRRRDGEVMGILSTHFVHPHNPPDEHVRQVELHARLASLALRNAQLLQAANEARRNAETANRVKAEFLAVMSHELRTPLNAVLGYADLLAAEVQGPLNEGQFHQVGRIKTSSRVLLDLIEEILTYARIEAGTEQLDFGIVDLRETLEESLDMVRHHAGVKGLELRTEFPDELLEAVTDSRKLRQVILNLLTNAIKFTETGSVITRVRQEHDDVVFEVEDTGAGIPSEELEGIFRPFRQVDQSATRRHGGAGLGLAVSRRLAGLLGGAMSVRSEPGKGSCFILRIPRVPDRETLM